MKKHLPIALAAFIAGGISLGAVSLASAQTDDGTTTTTDSPVTTDDSTVTDDSTLEPRGRHGHGDRDGDGGCDKADATADTSTADTSTADTSTADTETTVTPDTTATTEAPVDDSSL